MFVKLWMHEEVITVQPDSTIAEAEKLMAQHKIRRLPVISAEGRLLGILSKEDIQNALPSIIDASFNENARALANQAKVEAFMTKAPITADPMEPLEKVAATMRKNKVGGIPVVAEEKLVGIITESDIFQAFIEILGGNDAGVRIELSIGSEARSIYRTVDIFKKHDMHLLTLTACNDYSSDNRLLTLRFRGEDVDPLIDDLWSSGCKINSIIRE
jgi:acetoin utilization protein AcuB